MSTGSGFGAELGKWTFIERRQRGVAQQQSTHGCSQRGVGHGRRPGRHIAGKLFATAARVFRRRVSPRQIMNIMTNSVPCKGLVLPIPKTLRAKNFTTRSLRLLLVMSVDPDRSLRPLRRLRCREHDVFGVDVVVCLGENVFESTFFF